MNRIEKIKWFVNNQIPCTKCCHSSCGHSSYCCGCPAYIKWKTKFDEFNIDDITYEEAYNVSTVISLKKEIEKYMPTISEEVKKAFNL